MIGAAIEVHRTHGPDLLEHLYEECLCYELTSRKMTFTRQVVISVAAINDIHLAKMITYLKLTRLKLGLILNLNTTAMKSGIIRVVLNF